MFHYSCDNDNDATNVHILKFAGCNVEIVMLST